MTKWQWPRFNYEKCKLNMLGADMLYRGQVVWRMFGWRFDIGVNADSLRGVWNWGGVKLMVNRVTR